MNLRAVFVLPFVGIVVVGQDCDDKGILLYEDLGCTPQYGEDKKCPKKYSCLGLEQWTSKCYFRGKTYKHSEKADDSLSYAACYTDCYCSDSNNETGFVCAALDCPEWLGVPIGSECHRKYELNKCCSVGQTCPPFTDLEKCVVEGKEYLEGQRFHPSNTCLECVCQKGFKGKFEGPFCARQSCGQQLNRYGSSELQNSCAPFYSTSNDSTVLCCPSSFICSDGSETVQGVVKAEDTCKFGTKSLKVGQYVEKLNHENTYGRKFAKIRCECIIPPLLKCANV